MKQMTYGESITERLEAIKEKALTECPEGFELVGWVYAGSVSYTPLLSGMAEAVYKKSKDHG